MSRCFPPPWTVQEIPGGFKVLDADGQFLAYVYGRESKADADIAHVLTMDEARRIASKIGKVPEPFMLPDWGRLSPNTECEENNAQRDQPREH
jgi:hypothetical protein